MAHSLVSEPVAMGLVIAWVLSGLVTVGYLVLLEMLFHRLRKSHADHYREIGEPSLFLNNSITKGFGVVRYLLNRGYLLVPDERVKQLGEYSRRLFIVASVLFGLVLLLFGIFGVSVGRFD